jgi:hypothetical protein
MANRVQRTEIVSLPATTLLPMPENAYELDLSELGIPQGVQTDVTFTLDLSAEGGSRSPYAGFVLPF